jgi:thiosulfate reductase cytochrome b subunit
MLAQVNIWVDIIAVIMVAIGLGFWVFQIVGNTVTGRFRKKFVEKQWPHHDEIVPIAPKIMHGVHVASMITLAVSGLYTRFPIFVGGREIMKNVHFVAMYLVCIILLMRIYYAFMMDGRNFIMTLKDILNMPRVLMYYMFIGKSYPHLSKYNVMQKMTYGLIFPIFMVVQAYTGFSLMWPKILLGWAGQFAGGVAAAAAWARIVHFMVCMFLIMMTLIHMCLSFIEDYPALLMFFGLARQEVHEEHGHEEPATPQVAAAKAH